MATFVTLEDYIHGSRQEGFSDQQIREALSQNGWGESQLEEAFSRMTLVARAPQAVPLPVPKPPTKISTPSTHSPYSIVLALVLVVFLLIFGYHTISDLNGLFYSISGKLIIDAVMILPFLFVGAALHSLLLEQKERYRMLTIPYFAVGAWLILKLLYDVSQYVYSNVEVYGVYIVLLLIVITLTAAILLFQKYREIL